MKNRSAGACMANIGALQKAYMVGRSKPLKKSVFNNIENKFHKKVLLELAKRQSFGKIKNYVAITKIRDLGFEQIKQKKWQEAARLLDESRTSASPQKVSELGFLFSESFQSAAEAYLYYQLKKMDVAEKRMLSSIEAICEISSKFNVDFLFPRYIHLNINLIKIWIKQSKNKKAFQACCELLVQINNPCMPLSFHKFSIAHFDHAIEKLVLPTLIQHLLKEIALLTSNPSKTNGRLFFLHPSPNLIQIVNSSSAINNSPLKEWVEIKHYYYLNQEEKYLSSCAAFISKGPNYNLFLWRNLVKDLYYFVCEQENETKFKQLLFKDLATFS